MAIWAIFSDVHGRADRLARVLEHAQIRGAQDYLCLGDVGGERAIRLLTEVGARCVFGNWEASGWRGMLAPERRMVGQWPASFRADGFWATHASPVWPEKLEISGVVTYLSNHNLHWSSLFPSLWNSEAARWRALAELEGQGLSILFHGHTHIQSVWEWGGDGTLRPLRSVEFLVEAGSRYLVGVGSVGLPRDSLRPGYVLFDTQARRITMERG